MKLLLLNFTPRVVTLIFALHLSDVFGIRVGMCIYVCVYIYIYSIYSDTSANEDNSFRNNIR